MSMTPNEIGLQYASHWFEYHANQRQDVFKIFFLICAGVISCCGFLLQYNMFTPLIPLGALLGFFSIVFWMLDRRSRTLVEIGEQAYVHFWSEIGLDKSLCPPLLASRRRPKEIRYKAAYLLTFTVAFVAGIVMSVFGILKLTYPSIFIAG